MTVCLLKERRDKELEAKVPCENPGFVLDLLTFFAFPFSRKVTLLGCLMENPFPHLPVASFLHKVGVN